MRLFHFIVVAFLCSFAAVLAAPIHLNPNQVIAKAKHAIGSIVKVKPNKVKGPPVLNSKVCFIVCVSFWLFCIDSRHVTYRAVQSHIQPLWLAGIRMGHFTLHLSHTTTTQGLAHSRKLQTWLNHGVVKLAATYTWVLPPPGRKMSKHILILVTLALPCRMTMSILSTMVRSSFSLSIIKGGTLTFGYLHSPKESWKYRSRCWT